MYKKGAFYLLEQALGKIVLYNVGSVLLKEEKLQRSGIDAIKYHT